MANVSSVTTGYFVTAQEGFVTTTAGTVGIGAATVPLNSVAGYTNGEHVALVIDPTDANKKAVFHGTIDTAGTQVTGVTWTEGASVSHSTGATVVDYETATAWALYRKGIRTSLEDDGSLKTTAVQAALNTSGSDDNGWTTLATVPTITATNGNRSFDLSYPSVNYTDRLSKGMRLKIPRTGTAVQTQVTSLNGTNQYWNDTTVSGMTFTDDFTVSAWVKLSSYKEGVIAARYNGTSGWHLRVLADGRIVMTGLNASAANYSDVVSYQSLPLNKWVHVTAQLDMSAFTATSTTSYVMIDGVDVPCAVSRGGTNPTALVQAGNLEIGSYNTGVFPFAGKVAQVAIFSAKVTQANIRSIMNAPITPAVISAHSIVSAYAFDGNGTDLNTTNANNLTAQNGATATNADSPFNANAYGIIMSDPVYSGGNTTFNVQTPEGYPIPNETLGTSSYSGVKVPYGFPAATDKWRLVTINKTQASAAGTSWVNLNSFQMNLPIGEWMLGYKVPFGVASAGAANIGAMSTLSSTSPGEADPRYTTYVEASNSTYTSTTGYVREPENVTTQSIRYVNIRGITASTSLFYIRSELAASLLFAENAYL